MLALAKLPGKYQLPFCPRGEKFLVGKRHGKVNSVKSALRCGLGHDQVIAVG